MHSNTHLLELVLVTRVVMVFKEAILALMVEVVLWHLDVSFGLESFLLC
jgi:hypothetical protein